MKYQQSLQETITDFISRHIARGDHYFSPVLTAAQDFNCALASVMPSHIDDCITIHRGSPAPSQTILYICDNNDVAVGPAGFDSETLRLFISTCGAGLIASRVPSLESSSCLAAYSALSGANTIFIETLPSHDLLWLQFVREANTKMNLIIEMSDEGVVS